MRPNSWHNAQCGGACDHLPLCSSDRCWYWGRWPVAWVRSSPGSRRQPRRGQPPRRRPRPQYGHSATDTPVPPTATPVPEPISAANITSLRPINILARVGTNVRSLAFSPRLETARHRLRQQSGRQRFAAGAVVAGFERPAGSERPAAGHHLGRGVLAGWVNHRLRRRGCVGAPVAWLGSVAVGPAEHERCGQQRRLLAGRQLTGCRRGRGLGGRDLSVGCQDVGRNSAMEGGFVQCALACLLSRRRLAGQRGRGSFGPRVARGRRHAGGEIGPGGAGAVGCVLAGWVGDRPPACAPFPMPALRVFAAKPGFGAFRTERCCTKWSARPTGSMLWPIRPMVRSW